MYLYLAIVIQFTKKKKRRTQLSRNAGLNCHLSRIEFTIII